MSFRYTFKDFEVLWEAGKFFCNNEEAAALLDAVLAGEKKPLVEPLLASALSLMEPGIATEKEALATCHQAFNGMGFLSDCSDSLGRWWAAKSEPQGLEAYEIPPEIKLQITPIKDKK